MVVAKNKLPFDYVNREVDKLYSREIDLNDLTAIDKQCEFIVAFVNACGYSEEEFIRAMFGFDALDADQNGSKN